MLRKSDYVNIHMHNEIENIFNETLLYIKTRKLLPESYGSSVSMVTNCVELQHQNISKMYRNVF